MEGGVEGGEAEGLYYKSVTLHTHTQTRTQKSNKETEYTGHRARVSVKYAKWGQNWMQIIRQYDFRLSCEMP